MLTKEELPECPVATTVSLIGSKWKLLIIRNLLERPWRFNELKKNLEGISQKVLTDSLRSMEEDGLITRTVYPEVPPHVEYALSDLGETMRPILDDMKNGGHGIRRIFKREAAFTCSFPLLQHRIILNNRYSWNVFNASIVLWISSSSVHPSISAPLSITSLEQPAANPLLLYFFFTDFN